MLYEVITLQMTHTKAVGEKAEYGQAGDVDAFDSYEQVARAEWDTLLFFFGVIMCVGALGYCGWLALGSQLFYGELGATEANILVGLISSVLDNIPRNNCV